MAQSWLMPVEVDRVKVHVESWPLDTGGWQRLREREQSK